MTTTKAPIPAPAEAAGLVSDVSGLCQHPGPPRTSQPPGSSPPCTGKPAHCHDAGQWQGDWGDTHAILKRSARAILIDGTSCCPSSAPGRPWSRTGSRSAAESRTRIPPSRRGHASRGVRGARRHAAACRRAGSESPTAWTAGDPLPLEAMELVEVPADTPRAQLRGRLVEKIAARRRKGRPFRSARSECARSSRDLFLRCISGITRTTQCPCPNLTGTTIGDCRDITPDHTSRFERAAAR